MGGSLTTHVLDTAQGCPAANLRIELWQLDPTGNGRTLIKMVRTNSNGRTNEPLLSPGKLEVGIYELIFAVGEYYASHLDQFLNPPFLDFVPVRFGVSDETDHYHVPLLVSPWSYSIYRGN